jgi:hypothetical protein
VLFTCSSSTIVDRSTRIWQVWPQVSSWLSQGQLKSSMMQLRPMIRRANIRPYFDCDNRWTDCFSVAQSFDRSWLTLIRSLAPSPPESFLKAKHRNLRQRRSIEMTTWLDLKLCDVKVEGTSLLKLKAHMGLRRSSDRRWHCYNGDILVYDLSEADSQNVENYLRKAGGHQALSGGVANASIRSIKRNPVTKMVQDIEVCRYDCHELSCYLLLIETGPALHHRVVRHAVPLRADTCGGNSARQRAIEIYTIVKPCVGVPRAGRSCKGRKDCVKSAI